MFPERKLHSLAPKEKFWMYLVFLSLSLDFQVDGTNNRVNKPLNTLVMSRVKVALVPWKNVSSTSFH